MSTDVDVMTSGSCCCEIIESWKTSADESAEHHIDEYGEPCMDGVQDADAGTAIHGGRGVSTSRLDETDGVRETCETP